MRARCACIAFKNIGKPPPTNVQSLGTDALSVILGYRAKDHKAPIKKSLWLNGLNTHQSPEYQGFNPSWRDENFVSIKEKRSSKAEGENIRRKQKGKRESERERETTFSLSSSLPSSRLSLHPSLSLSLPHILSFFLSPFLSSLSPSLPVSFSPSHSLFLSLSFSLPSLPLFSPPPSSLFLFISLPLSLSSSFSPSFSLSIHLSQGQGGPSFFFLRYTPQVG